MAFNFGTAVLIIAALFGLLTTWSAGAAPEVFAERLGLKVMNAGGINEIRAQYAAVFLAIAVVCIASLAGVLSRQAAFVVLSTVFGGLIVGRVFSLVVNGGTAGYGPTIIALYFIDATGLAVSVAAYFLDGRA